MKELNLKNDKRLAIVDDEDYIRLVAQIGFQNNHIGLGYYKTEEDILPFLHKNEYIDLIFKVLNK